MAIIASTLARIKSDPLSLLGGAQRINNCFARAGHVWRDRLLNPANTIALFVLQVLHGNTAISHLRHLSAVAVAACDSSYCAARARLSPSAVAAMVAEVCGVGSRCVEDAAAAATVWLGRRVLLADGTGTLTPDAPALQEAWPQSSNQKPGCGFPAIKLLGLLDLASGAILHLTITCLRVQEFSQLGGLLGAVAGALRPRDVLLADRGFCSFAHLAMLAAASVGAVFRMHQRQVVDFTPGRPHRGKSMGGGSGGGGGNRCRAGGVPSSRFVRRLGPEDQIVEWARPAGKRPAWMTEAQYAALPPTLPVRELRYGITVKGRRTRVVTIATTLLDPVRYPKREIAKLYGLRWEIETDFRHLKTTMGMEHLKCKTVDGVLRELMIYVLVYNLVRAAMAAAACRQRVADANRVSFVDSLRWLRSILAVNKAGPVGAVAAAAVPRLIVNRERPGRRCPRVKKKRMKEYDLMNRPRAEYTEPMDVTEVAS